MTESFIIALATAASMAAGAALIVLLLSVFDVLPNIDDDYRDFFDPNQRD